MTQPTNTNYKSIEEQVETLKYLDVNEHVLNPVSGAEHLITWVKEALQERDTIARQQERNRIKEWVHEHKDLTTTFGSRQAYWYLQAEELLSFIRPLNNKE